MNFTAFSSRPVLLRRCREHNLAGEVVLNEARRTRQFWNLVLLLRTVRLLTCFLVFARLVRRTIEFTDFQFP